MAKKIQSKIILERLRKDRGKPPLKKANHKQYKSANV